MLHIPLDFSLEHTTCTLFILSILKMQFCDVLIRLCHY